MSQKLFNLSAVAGFVMASSSVMAAVPVSLDKDSVDFIKNNFSQPGHSISSNKNSLEPISNLKDFNQVYHKRMQQMYDGVPVFGGQAIIHSSSHQGLMASKSQPNITGKVYRSLAYDLGAKPQDNSAAALNKLKQEYKHAKISEEQSQLTVYVDKDNKAHWAYMVSFLAEPQQAMPAKPNAIIDAKTLKVFRSWNDVKTEKHVVKGYGFGGNLRVGPYAYGLQGLNFYPALEITRDDYTQKCYMETKQVKVIDMGGDYYAGKAPMTFDCPQEYAENTYATGYNADGLDKVNGAFSPSNDALYMGYVINHMYKEWYGMHALVENPRDPHDQHRPMQIVMRVHYGYHYENAFWDGKQMTYGDGHTSMHPLVSMGVGAHEISHGFTEQHSSLIYSGQSGGMNEAFSDMAAMAAVYYSYNEAQDPSFQIGDRIMKEGNKYGDALRYMDKPSRDGRSIDDADQYNGQDVHFTSGVYNRLFYLIATSPGWNTRKAFNIMVQANAYYWEKDATFESGACGVLQGAVDYGYPLEAVKVALDTVKIKKYNECVLQDSRKV